MGIQDKPKAIVVDLDFHKVAPSEPSHAYPRFDCEHEVRVLPCDSRQCTFQSAKAVCCWACGVGLRSPVDMKVGDHFFADLGFSDELVLYVVLHCEPLSAGGYRIDAELVSSAVTRQDQIFKRLLG